MDDERVLAVSEGLGSTAVHVAGFPPRTRGWFKLDARVIRGATRRLDGVWRLGQKPNNGVWTAATARAWRATPRPLHARAHFAPTPNPPPRPFVALVQVSGLPPHTRSHTMCKPNHAERHASVHDGR